MKLEQPGLDLKDNCVNAKLLILQETTNRQKIRKLTYDKLLGHFWFKHKIMRAKNLIHTGVKFSAILLGKETTNYTRSNE